MKYAETAQRIAEYRQQISAIRKQMREAQAQVEPQEVGDYEFQTPAGPVRLSQLFVANRVAFVVSSPDAPEVQREFAASRGWKFPMVSHVGTTFAADMGFRGTRGWTPGVSVFQRQGARIVRVSAAVFSPGDDFCTVWHLFDLLPDGAAGWSPRFGY